ncbi:MAG: DUF433 domain-containing protein [Isosphaeraceae bacterium]
MAIGVEELVARLGSGIEKTPGVCGGAAQISGTRIFVWRLESARRRGSPEVEILREHPELRAADLVNAWTYVAANAEEIEEQIRRNEQSEGSAAWELPAELNRARVVKTPGICGGAARVDGSRIPVWQLIEEREEGASESQLLNSYRTLTARDLVAAWDYAEAHPDEIAAEIRRNALES